MNAKEIIESGDFVWWLPGMNKPSAAPAGCMVMGNGGIWVPSTLEPEEWGNRFRYWPIRKKQHYDDLTAIPSTVRVCDLDDDTRRRLLALRFRDCDTVSNSGEWLPCHGGGTMYNEFENGSGYRMTFPYRQRPAPINQPKHYDDLTAIPPDVRVCDLDDDTRTRLGALQFRDCDVFNEDSGKWLPCRGGKTLGYEFVGDGNRTTFSYRQRPAPKMRAMTLKECLALAAPNGWVFIDKNRPSRIFTSWSTLRDHKKFNRARIETLNDDGTGGEWMGFEVEE